MDNEFLSIIDNLFCSLLINRDSDAVVRLLSLFTNIIINLSIFCLDYPCLNKILNKPCCCIKFGAWIYQTLTQRGMAVKSMSSPGSIQK